MGAIAKEKDIFESRRGFGLELSTIASEVFEGMNAHFKDFHVQLSSDLPYIQHRMRFALVANAPSDDNALLRADIVDDVISRYSEMLSPLKNLDVLERLLRVGKFIEQHPNGHKSRYLLERYQVAQSVITQCAEKRGFEYVDIK